MLRRAHALPSAWHLQVAASAQLMLRPKLPRFKNFNHFVGEAIELVQTQMRDIRRVQEADDKGWALFGQILRQEHPPEVADFLARRARRYHRLLRGTGNPWKDQ